MKTLILFTLFLIAAGPARAGDKGTEGLPDINKIHDQIQKVTDEINAIDQPVGETPNERRKRLGLPLKAPVSGVDLSAMDKTADPCVDFYQYACGNWVKNNPVPADQSRWGRFNELAERNREVLRKILETAGKPDSGRTENNQKIGDFYASCMDEKTIDAKGAAALKPELDRINKLRSKRDLVAAVARLHAIGINAIFDFGSSQDFQDASRMIAAADQSGLSLPDRDYYLTEKFAAERADYEQHVKRMFTLLGDAPSKAGLEAKAVLTVETAIAKDSMDRVARRDPHNVHHKMKLAELAELTPAFNWNNYLKETGSPAFVSLDVANPDFFKKMQGWVDNVPLQDWKTYLRWHLVHGSAAVLPAAFVNEDFDFFGKRLRGQKEIKARWKRCTAMTDMALGEALGFAFVNETFSELGKRRTLDLVHGIETSMAADIDSLAWMSPETKKKALEKLHAITNKIGYPDKWRDYGKLEIKRGDALGNYQRGFDFEFHRQLGKINQPVDKGEWYMTPPTVNAYYDPQMNNINFPAGILQLPFFNEDADDAVNYGAIGAIVGHETTHAFDDEGSQYDADGNLKDWWTEADKKAFEARTQGLVDQYSKYVAVKDSSDTSKDIHVNGKLTLGENVADNGGAKLSFLAMTDQKLGVVDGLTPEQRFFLGFGQIWCNNQTDQNAKVLATVDPHSPPKYRVEGTLANIPAFWDAFSCKQKPQKPNGVW